MKSYKEVTKQ